MSTIRSTTIPNSAVIENPFIIHATTQPSSAPGEDATPSISGEIPTCPPAPWTSPMPCIIVPMVRR